jgi:hypothetical protein
MEPKAGLTLENFREVINSYDRAKWEPMLALILEIERTRDFGRLAGGEQVAENVSMEMYYVPREVVLKFTEIAYEMPVIFDFDWMSWGEGSRIAMDENFDFDTIDIPEKCKLITAFVRNDRFCEGFLIARFRSGQVLRILRSIERQVRD